MNEVKKEIPSITNLARTTVLTAIENKTHNISNLVKTITKTKTVTITQELVKMKKKYWSWSW